MSNSLANLAVKVDVTSVAAAMRQLDALAAKAGEIEKKVSGASTRVTQANNRAAVAATQTAKESTNQASKLDATIARQMRTVDQAKQRYENLDRAIRQSNLAMGVQTGMRDQAMRSLDRYLRVMQSESVTARQAASANIQYSRAMTNLNNNLKDGNALVRERIQNTQRLSRESVAASNAQAAASRSALTAAIALERAVGSRATATQNVDNRAVRQLTPEQSAPIIRQNAAALAQYEAVVRQYGIRSVEATRAQTAFNQAIDRSRNAITTQNGLLTTLNNNARTISASFGAANASLGGFSRVVFSTQAALAALTGTLGLREIVQGMMNLERFTSTLRTVSASVADFNNNMRFLFAEGDRIGFNVAEVGNSFARLSVAMQGAGFTSQQTQETFTNLATASRNFGVSSADTMGIIRALEQSMSKGKFMAEEVRLQMGDRLPIAMAALQAAVEKVDGAYSNVSDRMERGTLDVQRYAAEFTRQIMIMSGGVEALARTSQSISAAFGRFGNEWTRLLQALEAGGFGQAVIAATDQITALMAAARESGFLATLGEIALTAANNLSIFLGFLAGLAAIFVGNALVAGIVRLARALSTLTPFARIISGLAAAAVFLSSNFARMGDEAASYARSVNQSFVQVNQASERTSTVAAEATALLSQGLQAAADQTRNSTEELAQSFIRMGATATEAIQRAGEASLRIVEAQNTIIREQIRGAERDLENFMNASTRIITIRNQLEANIRDTSAGAYGGPSNEFLNVAGQFQNFIEILRQGREPIAAVGSELRRLAEEARVAQQQAAQAPESMTRATAEQFNPLITLIESVITSLGRLNETDLQRLVTQITSMAEQLRVGTSNANGLRGALQNMGVNPNTDGPMLSLLSTNVAPFTLSTEASRRQRRAEDNLRRRLTEDRLIGPAQQGRRTFLGANPELGRIGDTNGATILGFLQMRAQGGDAGAADALRKYNEELNETSRAAGAARNAVEELVHDMGLQARAAEAATGAQKAHADAIRRLEDAAKGRGQTRITQIERDRVEAVVIETLTARRQAAFRVMERERAGNDAISAAYLRNAQAGRQAEIAVEARQRALETARETDANFTQVLEEETRALERNAASLANRNATRDIADRREEIQLLEQEGRLIGTNVNTREQEVAALRERARLLTAGVTNQDTIRLAEQSARDLASVRQQNTQIENSFNEISSAGEQAFERIGNSITEAFANGTLRALSFRDIMKSVMSEIIQRVARLAILNPILNSLFGGTRGTLGTALSGVSSIGKAAAGGGFGLDQILSGVGLGRSSGGLGSLFGGGSGGSMFGGIGNSVTEFLGRTAFNAPFGGSPSFNSPDFIGSTLGAPVSIGATLGAIGGIAGGAFGIYNGIQKGGIGGAVGGLGGAAGMAAGIATLTGIGASLLPVLGPLALLLPILGSLLPGQKPSSKEQGAMASFEPGADVRQFGFGGAKFSQANADQAGTILNAVLNQQGGLANILGFNAAGGVDVRSLNSRKDGQPGTVQIRIGTGGALEDFANTEEGLRALAARSSVLLFEAFREAAGDVQSEMAGIVRGSASMEALTANLEFFSGAYKALQDTTLLTDRWTSALVELNAPFEAAIARANELGLSTQGLADAQAAVVADAQRRRDLQVDALMAGLSSREASLRGDVQGAALISFDVQARAQLEQLRDSMRDLGVTGENAANALARAERILGQERLAIQQEAAERMAAEQQATLDSARSAVIEAYNRESAELESLANRMGDFARSLRDFRQGLLLGNLSPLSPEERLREARSQFDDIARRAQLGDVDAIEELQGASQSLLEASREYYASSEEYFRDFERVQQVLQNTESLAQRQAQIATDQLNTMRQQVDALGILNTSVLSLADTMAAFAAAAAAAAAASATARAPQTVVGGPGDVVNGRSIGAQVGAGNFDLAGRASAYLAANPDVASAIAGGNLFGGLSEDEAAIAHFSLFGINEGRSFARGGMHRGGLRLVGEEGPEIEITGPARYWSFEDTQRMLNGGSGSNEIVAELQGLRAEVSALRATQAAGAIAIRDAVQEGNATTEDMAAAARRKSAA